MKQSLLIVAAGKSSRFGGYPKALAEIGRGTNVENTIQLALPYFETIYLAVNEETYSQFKKCVRYCELFEIQTGNGDAHSLLKCLKHIRKVDSTCEHITACWGDAYLLNSTPFIQLEKASESFPNNKPVLVACAEDKYPYAWFETDGNNIKKSYFADVNSPINSGIHDQSMFFFNVEPAIDYLEKYKISLNVKDVYDPDGPEMKLLYSFEYLYNSKEFIPAQYILINSGNVLSFNTRKELENIRYLVCLGLGEQ